MNVARTVDELKVADPVVLAIGDACAFADYFVIGTCESRVQMRAAAVKIRELAKESGRQALGIEGEQSESWLLVDYGDVVIHMFSPQSRAYYGLERLWGDAKKVNWRPAAANA
jgi:ribosome-associated protein